MLTSTHILLGAAVASRPKMKFWQIGLAWIGGFAPDLSIFVMVIVTSLTGPAGGNLWSKPDGMYWQEPWQFYSAISNSFPLWALIFFVAFLVYKNSATLKTGALAVLIFGAGYYLHIMFDFVTHADDAHIQFWPFSDWRFNSPISYYQRQYYGQIVSIIEAIGGLGIITFLIIRFKQWWVRIVSGLMAFPYAISLWIHEINFF